MRIIALALIVLSVLQNVAIAADTNSIEYIVVDGVLAFDRRPNAGKDNLFPWERARIDQSKPQNGLTEIVISNSCGLAEFVYAATPLAEYAIGSERTATEKRLLVQLDEWCNVATYSFNAPTLVAARVWNKTRYVLKSTPIYRDDKQRPYVADIEFIEQANWASLKKPIAPLADWTCISADAMAPDQLAQYRRLHWLTEDTRGFCHSFGVYLQDTVIAREISGSNHGN
jgi:hypothetical protein